VIGVRDESPEARGDSSPGFVFPTQGCYPFPSVWAANPLLIVYQKHPIFFSQSDACMSFGRCKVSNTSTNQQSQIIKLQSSITKQILISQLQHSTFSGSIFKIHLRPY